jgi:hypothetical protein
VFYSGVVADNASFGSIDPKQAKARRAAIAPLFSRKTVIKLEWVIREKVKSLVSINHTTFSLCSG